MATQSALYRAPFGPGGSSAVDAALAEKLLGIALATGGDYAYGQPATNDPIIGKPVVLMGNTFGGRASHARMVDIDPYCPWSTQIFFNGIKLGDDQTFITGQQYMRMHSRLFFVPRDLGPGIIIAGVMGVIFQTTFPFDQLNYKAENSPLLQALIKAMQQPGAQGLMLRFTAFSTLYYQNGIFNDAPLDQRPRTADEIEKMYKAGMVFSNPAYSTVVGTFGVWNQGELSTAPSGHLLAPQLPPPVPKAAAQASYIRQVEVAQVFGHGHVALNETLVPNPNAPAGLSDIDASAAADTTGAPSPPPTLPLGPALAELGATGNIISLDLCNTIPDAGATGPKYDYGPISVGVQFGVTGSFTPIGSFSNYDWSSYMKKSGIVDVPINYTPTQVKQWLQQGGLLALQVGPSGPSGQTVALEQPFYADTDSRGIYLDECNSAQLTVQVRFKNGTPPAGTQVLLAQYYPQGLNTATGAWQLFGSGPTGMTGVCTATPDGPYLNFPGATNNIVPVTIPRVNGATAPYGEATVTLGYNTPGLPVVAFYPFTGPAAPTPQAQVTFGATLPNAYSIGTAYFCNVRTMSADNYLLQEFVDCWNGTGSYAGTPPYNRLSIWNFIYNNILYVYDALFPVMDQFMPLGSLESIEAAVDQLVTMIAAEWVDESTLYMPVTRDLSAAKRLILLTWGNLVNRKYPQEPLQPLNVPCNE